jgi:hypothetical protein
VNLNKSFKQEKQMEIAAAVMILPILWIYVIGRVVFAED